MKHFARFFLAVAALVVGVACTTDATEDLGVNPVGQTTLTLSLEESRTQLGEVANGVYPVTWSYGDQISVNGVKSSAIEIADDATSAKFTFDGILDYPYAVAYPAAENGKVVFADVQQQEYGTFTNGAAAMYGYAESAGVISLKHLTGVLKFGVTGSAAITRVQISTIDRKPIAGEFELDFVTGELKPTENSKYTIECTFEESADGDAGMVLSSTPYYFHFAVPAGEYNELYVTLYSGDSEVMYAVIKADDTKPLKAGKVRNFSTPLVYEPNASLFVIHDKDSLREFASAAATLDKDAVVVDDIDMTGESWTPIEGYSKRLIGNGHAIKGLTAPLFGITSASIKGLHLVEVNINETVTPNVGAFARRITATDTVAPSIENCTASGKIVVNCPDYTYKGESQYYEFSVGGVVGALLGTAISNCSSSVAIDIDQQVATSNATEIRSNVGGVAGSVTQYDRTDKTRIYAPMVNCSNSGNIEYANGSYNGEVDYVMLSMGGVLGIAFNNNRTADINNLTNSGDITVDATFSKYNSRLGGIVGWAYTSTLTKCVNSGNFTYNSGGFFYLYYGGIVGFASNSSIINDVHNTGAIKLKKEVKQLTDLVLGGIVGYQQNADSVGTGVLNNATNDGAITIEANMPENGEENLFRIGGIAGWSQCENTDNTNNGNITISGNLYNANSADHSVCVAGIVGYKTVDAIDGVENNGDITVSAPVGYAAGTDCRLWAAGITGYSTTQINDAKNTGDIEITGSQNILALAGIAGYFGNLVTNVENTGNLKLKTTDVGSTLYVSGCLARSAAAPETGYIQTGWINRGSISVDTDTSKNLYIAGCLAHWNEKVAVAIRAAENYGPITVKTTSNGTEACIGGVISYMYGTSNSRGLHNHKSATINVDVDVTGGKLAVGGLAYGLRDALDAAKSGEPANGNDADIFITGSTSANMDVGGIICTPNNYGRTSITNNGNITITGAVVGGNLRVGGFESNHSYGGYTKNVVNNGDITIDSTTKVQGAASIGGLAGGASILANAAAQSYENCSNTGDITFSGEAGLGGVGNVRMGGLLSAFNCIGTESSTAQDSSLVIVGTVANSGNITYNGKLHPTDSEVLVGGIIGEFVLNTKDNSAWTGTVANTGNITCTGTHGTNTYVGGIFGKTNKSFANGKVDCTISAEGYNNVGMVLGSPRTAEVVDTDGTVTTPAVIASNFAVRGSILGVTLDSENYFNYIYGGTTDWTGVENYDGCTLLTE